jgi:hypothetical protein
MPDPGYRVDTWFVDGLEVQTGGNNYLLTNITASHTVAVSFTLMTYYTIIASAEANGSIDPNGLIIKEYGSDQLFTAIPDPGYRVDTWFVDGLEVQTGGGTYSLGNITADHRVTVQFIKIRYMICGYITEPDGNTPVEGIVVEATNGGGSDITDALGYYECIVDYGWSGVIDPNKAGYTFDPNSRIYDNVTADQNHNYTAIRDTFLISGYVIDSEMLTPLENVWLSADNNGGPFTNKYYDGGSAITDKNGYYAVRVDYEWSGKIIPSKYAYVFEPNSITYTNVTEDIFEEQNYGGRLLTYRIAGYIKNMCNLPIGGVLVAASEGGRSDMTDPNGFYEVWIDYNWSGTITPEKVHYTFDPNSRGYTNVLDDIINQDYIATNIYDLDCDSFIGLGDLEIVSENWLLEDTGFPCDFYHDEENIVNFFDFAEFAKAWREQ